jgi:hypothetical protein
MGDSFLFGTDEGLYAFETKCLIKVNLEATNARLIPLSNRRYSHINTIPEIGMIVSRSGKYDVVSVHDMIADMSKLKKKSKFESETKLRKMKETTGCHSYSICKLILKC